MKDVEASEHSSRITINEKPSMSELPSRTSPKAPRPISCPTRYLRPIRTTRPWALCSSDVLDTERLSFWMRTPSEYACLYNRSIWSETKCVLKARKQKQLGYGIIIQQLSIESKKIPQQFSYIIPKRFGIFSPHFTRLLYVPIHARRQIFTARQHSLLC